MEIIILLICGAIIYLTPTCVAYGREHNNTLAIFGLNLLLGWTFLFWAIALVWSLTSNTRKHTNGV